MKIITFNPGLGNQLIVFLFYKYLKEVKGYKVYPYFRPNTEHKHNGSDEILRKFQVDLPKPPFWLDKFCLLIRILNRFFHSKHLIDYETEFNFVDNSILYHGYWQDIKTYFDDNRVFYFENAKKFKFKLPEYIGSENLSLIQKTQSKTRVSLHIRRGDYLDSSRGTDWTKSADSSYYHEAICMAKKQLGNFSLLVFSDDIEWVSQNMKFEVDEIFFINWNKGENSYLDMYLMSLCNGSIIANSSFSYWGAMLGPKKDIVVYPKKWIEGYLPDIFPTEWIAI